MANQTAEAVSPDSTVKANAAAYLPFRTFLSAIESLEHGIPKKIDRTIWRNQSGVTQSQILMAFRFFELVDDSDQPTELLHELVEKKEERAATMTKLLNEAYTSIIDHDLTKMTPKMLDDAMEQYSVAGDTKRKAVTFFLRAAKFAGMPMHPLLSSQVRMSGPRKKRTPKRSDDTTMTITTGEASGVRASNTKSVKLRNGGSVSLTVAYDPFSISTEDRDFVFGLVDTLKKYSEKYELVDQQEDEEDEE